MSNSKLVSYTKLSPNHSGKRNHAIDTISIHCMAGNLSVESCGALFADPEREASSNYGIGSDGRIALYVDEENRSRCTSSSSNDNRAITIEVANTEAKHPWPVSDKAYNALIDLLVDICQRNGIKKLLWKADKSLIGQVDKQNMTVHRWFANKACPGDYLYERHGAIAEAVNKRLEEAKKPATPAKSTLYRVQVGSFKNKANATAQLAKVKSAGFDAILVQVAGLYKVQVGAFSVKANAKKQAEKVKAAGFDAFITTEEGQAVSVEAVKKIGKGSLVRVKQGAKTYTGGNMASFVYTRNHIVKEISGNRVVITYNGVVVAAVHKDDLTVL